MRIQELEYHDKESGWQLAPTEFFPGLTLLVGISGVGKTRILRAVSELRRIANGDDDRPLWGVHWNARFTTDDGGEYRWSGAFEERNADDDSAVEEDHPFFSSFAEGTKPQPEIIKESLIRDGATIVHRDHAKIKLSGQLMPKLSRYESVVHILREEDDIAPVYAAFDKILEVDHSNDLSRLISPLNVGNLVPIFKTLDKIRRGRFSTKTKLALVHIYERPIFDRIIDQFLHVFPQVQKVNIKRFQTFDSDFFDIQIKERGVSKWIPEHKISSGMWRTLIHLSRMALWPDGMVVLIDEFENSLGVNCIDFVMDDLVEQSDRLQFIITSHHPYIINNIDTQNWKIVVREGSVVSTRDAAEFGLADSSHEAFFKLMNLSQYQNGIAAE